MNNTYDPASFYGCYILRSTKPEFEDSVYIGYTVDPRRRIDQHNGVIPGGAKKTSLKRPWEMVLTVYGFPSDVLALQFEWAWQNPTDSHFVAKAIANVKGAGGRQSLRFKIRTLFEMLNVPPFNRFPLTLHWLNITTAKQRMLLEGCPAPPQHMHVNNALNSPDEDRFGSIYLYSLDEWLMPVSQRRAAGHVVRDAELEQLCDVCLQRLPPLDVEEHAECVHEGCVLKCHVVCLARQFLSNEPSEVIPTTGKCPWCKRRLIWGDVVLNRQKRRRLFLKQMDITL